MAAVFSRVLLCLILLSASGSRAWAIEARLTYDELTSLIGSVLQGIEIRLHNHGTFRSGSYHDRNASYIRLPRAGFRRDFDIPAQPTARVLGRRYIYYVSDVRSDTVTVSVADGGFDVAISFKLRGKELVPRCVIGVGKAARTCAAAPFPEIDLSEAKVLGRLTPHVTNGNLAFKLSDLQLALDVRVPICDNVFGAWTCTIADVEGLKRRKREEVRKLIADLFAKNRDAIARTVTRAVLRDFVSVQHVRLDAQGLAISGRLRIQAGLAAE